MTTLATRPRTLVRTSLADFLGLDRPVYAGLPQLDVRRTEQGFVVELPVAGFKPDEIDVTLDENVLTVTGASERRRFTRSLAIPEEIDADSIAASVEHGLLTLTLNVHAKAQPRKIAITAN